MFFEWQIYYINNQIFAQDEQRHIKDRLYKRNTNEYIKSQTDAT
jgi:hypothetical protein